MEFRKNQLINKTIDEYATTWSHTLDTADYIDKKFLKRIDEYIGRNLKRKFNEIDIYHYLYLQDRGFKLNFYQKLKIYFSGLKPLYLLEKKELEAKNAKKNKKNIKLVFNMIKNKEFKFKRIKNRDVVIADFVGMWSN